MTDSPKKVLVVDDEKMIRDVVVKILNLKGHHPSEAESGDDALQKLEEISGIEYVILDLSMPGKISGEEAFDLIRSQYRNLKIIIASGFIEQSQRQYFLEQGAHAILEKPYKIDDIVNILT